MATNKNPGTNRIREALSRIYDGQTPYFREYLRRYQEDPKSRVFAPLAEAYRRLGKLDEAIQICLEGLSHHPDFAGGRVALAKCYYDKKEFALAKDQLERVVESIPENLLAQKLLGDVSLALGDQVTALEAYQMALRIAPDDAALAQKIQQLEKEDGSSELDNVQAPAVSLPPTGTQSMVAEFNQTNPSAMEAPVSRATEPEMEMIPLIGDDGSIELVPMGEEHNFASIENLLGGDDEEEDAFQVESIQAVFEEEKKDSEINTETLGDLYFAQGQYERCLRIFEKIQKERNSVSLVQKIEAARARLGVGEEGDEQGKKIELLKGILDRLHDSKTDDVSL